MLNTFPHLLVLGFFAPMLLRVAVACLFFCAAYAAHKNRAAVARLRFPVIGTASWAGNFTALVYAVIGLMLFFGGYTQIAAIAGAVAAFKAIVLGKNFDALFPYSRSTYVFVLIICLSLIISGAGALALDLPL